MFKSSNIRISLYALTFLLLFMGVYLLTPEPEQAMHIDQAYLGIPEEESQPVPLIGDWQFQWQELSLSDWKESEFVNLPETWEDGPFGYASYRLIIGGLVPGESYALKIPYMATAYSLFIDQREVSRNGQVGRTRSESRPGYLPKVVQFVPDRSQIELVLWVSNYHHRRGGPFQTVFVGRAREVLESDYWSVFTDGAFVILFMAMGLSQAAFFLWRKDRANLLLALLFFTISLSGLTGTPEVLIFRFFPAFPWQMYERICYFVSYSIPIWTVLLLENLYGGIERKHIILLLLPLFAVHLLVLTTPSYVFTLANEAFQLYAALIFSVSFGMLLEASIKGLNGARVFLLAYIVFVASALSAMLFTKDQISSAPFLPLSFMRNYGLTFADSVWISWDIISYILLLLIISVFSIAFFFKVPTATKRTLSTLQGSGSDPFQARVSRFNFSEREMEVCLLALQGKSNREIGEDLHLSLSTVKTYLSRVFKKAGVKTRAELFFLCYDQGLNER